eukprot:CAMPEP_0197675864 /NCGR_PEP_ID=MMETSP1338-20131121/85753_1 /TAXON_ID=43686 ORGANISM="Pelagodinium beii, Strain RCC1491" /NCGR_SAMPLE_ID=MMETSP1338 /ASSEMBLY_ACC=CAM_ASM_000754 /LENGTH=413 /DNA_ID=CAMNT_0043256471 /DNA_START=1 /DNA_END=1242 /DNA_ORIENTATION=-
MLPILSKTCFGFLAFTGANAAPLMGSPVEFPSRYHTSVRSLSETIMQARPPADASLDWTVTDQDESRWLLKVDLKFTDEEMKELKLQVARVEKHFRRIRGMAGDSNLKAFVPAQGIDHVDIFRLTAYASYYNIFYLNSKVISKLYWAVKQLFHQYADVYQFNLNQTYFMHGWFNCFRGGGKISPHRHCNGLSGNMAVHVPPGSFTRYGSLSSSKEYRWMLALQQQCQQGKETSCERFTQLWRYADDLPEPLEEQESSRVMPNMDGELVIFHGLVEHESSNVSEDMRQHLKRKGPTDCRMTLAFDIDTNPSDLHHSVPLYDPEDPWWDSSSLGHDIGSAIEGLLDDAELPAAFDWAVMPDKRAFAERIQLAKVHEGSGKLSSWLKEQLAAGWADFRSGRCQKAACDSREAYTTF